MQDIGIVSTYSFVVSFPCLCDFVLCCGNLVHELLVIALAVEVRIGFNNHFEGCFNFVYSLIRNCAILPCTSVNYVYKSLVLMLVIRLHAVYEIWIQVCPPFFLHFDCRFASVTFSAYAIALAGTELIATIARMITATVAAATIRVPLLIFMMNSFQNTTLLQLHFSFRYSIFNLLCSRFPPS